jgi:hypothetical protein
LQIVLALRDGPELAIISLDSLALAAAARAPRAATPRLRR